MKNSLSFAQFSAVLLFLLLCLIGCSNDNDSQTKETAKEKHVIVLKMHHHEAAGNALDVYFHTWAREVEKDSGGTVKITIFPGASLGSPKTALDMLTTGVCDIAWTFSGFHPGRFTKTDAISLPMLDLRTATEGTKVLNKMFYNTELIKSEFTEFKVLWMNTNAQNPIVTREKKITSLDDLKNLSIRVPGGPPTDFALALGYSPIGMAPGDIFSSIEKNVIEGYVIDWGGIENFKLYEVSKYYLNFCHYEMPFYCLMNKEKFASLPQQAQQAIEMHSGTKTALEVAAIFDRMYTEAILPEIEKRDAEIVTLSESETARFQERAQQVWQKWIDENSKKGLPAQQVFNKYLELTKALHP